MLVWPWHKATTLAERVRLYRSATADGSASQVDVERGQKRLAKWKAQPPFDSDDLFRQRLTQADLSEAELLDLLSGRAPAPPAASAGPPAWAFDITHALADSGCAEPGLNALNGEGQPAHRFLELASPLLGQAISRLRSALGSLPSLPGEALPDVATLEQIFTRLLTERLPSLLLRTLVLELNVARVQGLLSGDTSEERFQSFIDRIKQPQIRLELLSEYPVLGRQAVNALDQCLRCSLEFLERWRADWPAIRAAFCPGEEPGPLTRIEAEAGDRHRDGRAVWIVHCRSGFKMVYKPKPMAVDQHFQELLQWLNEKGASPPFRPLRVIDRGNYGWEEFVSPQSCVSREEVVRFYERTGGYLALLYALAAADFHYENLLAAGEHPLLIDLEALLHPTGFGPSSQGASDLAGRSFMQSVLGSGLLPVPTWSERTAGAFDLSGLGADVGQQIPTRVPGWENLGSDEMHFARKSEVFEASAHRAKLNGAVTNPLDYLEAIQNGFERIYRLLENHREELLGSGGWLQRFADDEIRVVLRNSSTYGDLLREGSHPDVMRDALDRERLFDRLWEEVKDRPSLAQLIPAETEALWRGDIPLFTTRPKSRDLWADADRHFKKVLDESGLECARRRLGQFGRQDLERQLWFLRASLTTLASRARTHARSRQPFLAEPGAAAGREEFLAASRAVGDRLAATAFRAGGEVTWIGLRPMREKQWLLVPLGLDFYDGVPGVGVFLAYLAVVSGDERYTSLARETLGVIRQRLRPERRQKGLSELGGFTGWGGALYTLAHLAMLWDEPALMDEAQEMVEVLPRRIEQDQELDIIGGAAGCIAALLCLHACRPSARVLDVATQCGEHLLSRARPMPQGFGWPSPFPCHGPLAGFSHGAAGISWALLELATQTGEDRFKTAALGGIAYERSLFSAKDENWPDLRVTDTDPEQVQGGSLPFPVSWCHGAPGIGLARLLCRRRLDDPLLDAELETALRTTVARGFGYNHCLCHGDLGNLELLLEAARVWPGSSWSNDAARLAAGILNAIGRDGWICGNPLGVESPGLMTGLAGIGYGLLRCAEPARVPSVLSLAPPLLNSASDELIKEECGNANLA